MRLGQSEIDILNALSRGETPYLASSHRLRLEMMWLVIDGPSGLRLTPEGERAARTAGPLGAASWDPPASHFDAIARRLRLERPRKL